MEMLEGLLVVLDGELRDAIQDESKKASGAVVGRGGGVRE